jgi:hypothetical protein
MEQKWYVVLRCSRDAGASEGSTLIPQTGSVTLLLEDIGVLLIRGSHVAVSGCACTSGRPARRTSPSARPPPGARRTHSSLEQPVPAARVSFSSASYMSRVRWQSEEAGRAHVDPEHAQGCRNLVYPYPLYNDSLPACGRSRPSRWCRDPSHHRTTSKWPIIPDSWCSRMWQWYIHSPGRSSGIQAIRTRPLGGMLTVSSHERNAGGSPFTSST